MKPMQRRPYCIGSSRLTPPGQVHFTMDGVHYDIAGRRRLGVASTFLADRLKPGKRVNIYIQKAHASSLPKDGSTPIIIVGTRIAAFGSSLSGTLQGDENDGSRAAVFGHQHEALRALLTARTFVCAATPSAWQPTSKGRSSRFQPGRADERGGGAQLCGRIEDHRPIPGGCLLNDGIVSLSPREKGGQPASTPSSSHCAQGRSVTPVRTTCPYCGVGCGVLATPDGRGGAEITGDPDHPANAGRLCSKGSALGETLGIETRLLHPIVDGVQTSWANALDEVVRRLTDIKARHGPEAIAFYLSGQLLTEDYYVANKLAKGFIGTPHVDTNSRLCMASSVAGHRRAFGADVVPQCYEDLDLADLVVLAGSNAAWCHPILHQRIQTTQIERGVRVVNIDPRRTPTSEGVDLQLSIIPGMDSVL